jgi:hypothetical protein
MFGFDPQNYQIMANKSSQPITVDGYITDPAWKEAQLIATLIQREPREGNPSSEKTEIRILYDMENLYIGIICFDSEPGKIVANEMRRDAELINNDFVEVVIDTFHDHRNAFYFATNPLGAQHDALVRDEGSNINTNWDGIWFVQAKRFDQGWSVEMALPFYTLRFNKGDNKIWGINFGRFIARKKEESYWTPMLRDFGFFGRLKISFYGHLTGLPEICRTKNIQVMPYLIGGGQQSDTASNFQPSGNLGLDLKYRLTSNITADLTANTDFAHVESDEEMFNWTRFSLFFPEKREFFLEGADIFRFGERYVEGEPPPALLFFSRTIGLSQNEQLIPVIGGIKITGKTGRYDLGALNILTGNLSDRAPNDRENFPKTNYLVFRLKRDVFEKSSVGVIVLSKDSFADSNSYPNYSRGSGIDFNLAFGQNLQIEGFLAKSFSPHLRNKDWAGSINFVWTNDYFQTDLAYTDIEENFNSEMGFLSRMNIRKFRCNLYYSPRPDYLNIRQTFFFNNLTYIENHSGQIESRNNLTGIFNIFKNRSELLMGYYQNYEYLKDALEISKGFSISPGRYGFNMFVGAFESDKSKNISSLTEIYYGAFYSGHFLNLNNNLSFKLARNINLEFIYKLNKFDFRSQGRKITTNLGGIRLLYSFTPRLFARAYIQWNDEVNRFRVNFLVRWIYKPGANIYLIYNETRNLRGQSFFRERTLMMKVTFLFN